MNYALEPAITPHDTLCHILWTLLLVTMLYRGFEALTNAHHGGDELILTWGTRITGKPPAFML